MATLTVFAVIQPFDPAGIVLAAVVNPVVITVALWMGWQADQWQKVLVAGFAAAFAGSIALWLATAAGLVTVRGYGGMSGVFGASFVFGMILAGIAYYVRRMRS
ncbi:MAG: hypothetical protein ACI89J_000926 [Hyphomicrobiaceae bacterium]